MKRKFKYLIPSLITLGILLIIFYCEKLYPFYNNSIVQVDADYQFIPVLYRIYDFLHGTQGIIYDDIGLGNNIYISMIIQGSIFSPLSLLLYFTERDNIVIFFNIIVIVKMCLLSLTTYIYINKSYKVNEYYKILFSVLYTFSGWLLLNYFNIMWLDSVILFPLIVMYLDKLLNENKYIGYVITLSLSLIISYYISYFILLFILFYSFIYIFIKLDKKKIKKTIFILGISTITSILISSFSLLPALYQTLISSRLTSSYTSNIWHNFINKSLYLMFSTVFLIYFYKLISKYKDNKKEIYFYIILIILFSIGLFIEPINLAIHMGSYWSFPYRYSFITLFILMMGSLFYINKYEFIGYKKYEYLRLGIFIVLAILVIYINNLYKDIIIDSMIILDFNDLNIYKKILIIFLILSFMTFIAINFHNKSIRYITISIVCLLQIFIYSGYSMYYSEGYYLSKNSNIINNNIKLIDSELERYKMGYFNYTPDYGFIYTVNTLDNWLHILPNKEIDVYRKLGYANTDTCIRSYGGTIFSDWLFNVGYLINREDINNKFYNLVDSYENYYLYKYNYNNAFGYIYNNSNIETIEDNNIHNFELHNKIYKDLIDKDKNIIKTDNYNYSEGEKIIKLEYELREKGFMYIYFNSDIKDINYIKVNGIDIDFKEINYIIDLGIYEDDIVIEIERENQDNIDFTLGYIKYNDITNLNSNVNNVKKIDNGYKINVNNNLDNGYLFLPINNIDGLIAYVNDKEVKIDSYLNNFVSIKLDNGNNNIVIKYEQPLFKLGILLTILGIVFLFIIKLITNNKILFNITYYVYILICLFTYFYIYGYSIFKYWS